MRLASDIIGRARRTLVDPLVGGEGTTWTQADMFDGLTMALTSLTAVKNDAFKVVADIPLVAGYVQRLPSTPGSGNWPPAGIAVFEVLANTTGPAINQVGRELLNNANPDWVRNTPDEHVREWMVDIRDRTLFLVNPPNDGQGSVTVMYGAVHQPITSAADEIQVSDIYETALWAYLVSFCYGMNTKRKDTAKEAYYMQLFERQVGLRTSSQVQTAPQLTTSEPQ